MECTLSITIPAFDRISGLFKTNVISKRGIFLPKDFEVSPRAMTDHVKTSAYVAMYYIWRRKTSFLWLSRF